MRSHFSKLFWASIKKIEIAKCAGVYEFEFWIKFKCANVRACDLKIRRNSHFKIVMSIIKIQKLYGAVDLHVDFVSDLFLQLRRAMNIYYSICKKRFEKGAFAEIYYPFVSE